MIKRILILALLFSGCSGSEKEVSNEVIEAQNENNNLVQIELSLEAKTYLAYKYKVVNRDKLLKKLKRANPNFTKQIFKMQFFIHLFGFRNPVIDKN